MKEYSELGKKVKNIIKYNISRKYFGTWTPAELNRCYMNTVPISLRIGALSVNMICDALWKEMSYNPKRFGNVSPFKFNDKNSLYFFIAKEINPGTKALNILSKIQTHLSDFWNMAKKYDETFAQNNCFKNTFITIESNIQSCSDTKPIPDFNYTMLGHLRTCIHIIASQNIADFNKRSYQEQIIDAVTSMYPELVQPKTAPVLPNNLSREEKYLENAIRNKSSEILDIQTRIDTLNNEYENPGDTSKDIARLEQSNSELKHLEQQLEGLRNRIRFATKEQKTA